MGHSKPGREGVYLFVEFTINRPVTDCDSRIGDYYENSKIDDGPSRRRIP